MRRASAGRRLSRTATSAIIKPTVSVAICAASDSSARLLVMNAPMTSANRKVAVSASAHHNGFSWRMSLGAWLWSCPMDALASCDARTLGARDGGDYYT
ncbi:hypothetical protein XHV734_1424 [Xanthomonas hortorum pv. vitians]|nr:hypothetical protein XHV734_1424 [Xanthomonas hortorum pv. vitians]